MTYRETLDFLFAQLPMYQRIGKAAYKADLNTTRRLDEYFGYPHRSYPSVHIAGTNGKGSTAHLIASALQAAGYRTGLYTSPHLRDYRERIKINGEMIPKTEVIRFVEIHQHFISQLKPSFFELTAALSFEYFARQGVEVAVIETGMGGRLDSTNIISPLLAVITNIGLDHTQFLGSSLAEIAGEKAGIIKTNTPLVVGETQAETEPVFRRKAKEKNAPIGFADRIFRAEMRQTSQGLEFDVLKEGKAAFENLKIDLGGFYQKKNVCTALLALEKLENHFEIGRKSVFEGFATAAASTGLLGRWQTIGQKPLTICDTGHNADGIRFIVSQLEKTPHQNLHVVLGVVNDKNLAELLNLLPPKASYYFAKAAIPRALDARKLCQRADKAGLRGEAFASVQAALAQARARAHEGDLVFVGGSTFVVADALSGK